jgi:hypothetical protein
VYNFSYKLGYYPAPYLTSKGGGCPWRGKFNNAAATSLLGKAGKDFSGVTANKDVYDCQNYSCQHPQEE